MPGEVRRRPGEFGGRFDEERPGELGIRPDDERPSGRRLARVPGERYTGADGFALVLSEPRRDRALLAGVGAALFVALVLGVAVGVFSLSGGLLILAPLGGLLIGGSISRAAWGGVEHRPDRALSILAVALALSAWPVGLIVEYVFSLLLLPEATAGLLERMAAAPFADYVSGRVRLIDLIELLLLAGLAWRSAR